jgi:hypothetical protein
VDDAIAAGGTVADDAAAAAAKATASTAAKATASTADEAAVAAANVTDDALVAAGKLSPKTQQVIKTVEAMAENADEAAATAQQAAKTLGPGQRILQYMTKDGKVMTFISSTGSKIGTGLRIIGKYAPYVGLAIDAGITLNEVGHGRSSEYADETAQEIQDIFTGKWGLWTPLGMAGVVYSPSRNINLITQGAIQSYQAVTETAKAMESAEETGEKTMAAHHERPQTAHDPLAGKGYMTYNTAEELDAALLEAGGSKLNPLILINPKSNYIVGQHAVEGLSELARLQGVQRELDRRGAELQDRRGYMLASRVSGLEAKARSGTATPGELRLLQDQRNLLREEAKRKLEQEDSFFRVWGFSDREIAERIDQMQSEVAEMEKGSRDVWPTLGGFSILESVKTS